ncbi:hypothetical protein [Campylobacter troglodytis]|uniref:hypothetical protein n=1 Tax=Campylobacter troglodytis TaxID=654363 RepID=UPI00115A3AF1|nr:hypothetical protein [Campylobacter troglodytis]TQR53572.1 hypothetical protein DMC01_11075 [Campylobacter troglodytis]
MRGKAKAFHKPCHIEGKARSISDSQSEDSLEYRDSSLHAMRCTQNDNIKEDSQISQNDNFANTKSTHPLAPSAPC